MDVGAALDQVNAALRQGDLTALAAMEGLAEDMASLAATPHFAKTFALQLPQLRQKAQEQAILLEASARGIRAALARLTELRRAGQGLSGYGPKGEAVRIAEHSGITKRF